MKFTKDQSTGITGIVITGDIKNQEKAETRIIFPGGSVSVVRTSNNEYWVHILVNHKQVDSNIGTLQSKRGEIVDTRIDRDFPHESTEIPDKDNVYHIATRITTN